MIRRPPRTKRHHALIPYTTRFRSPPAMKSRAACHDGSPSVQKPMPSMAAVRRGTSGGPEHERAVVAAEAEGVVHRVAQAARSRVVERSEEHTSELQSLMRISYAVFCLQKKNYPYHQNYNHLHM